MKKSPNRTVAKLRNIIGKTQEQFALMLGVSKDTIVSVENGRNRLTPGLAYRIHVATGVNQLNLLENTGEVWTGDRDRFGRGIKPYTKEDFERWRKSVYGPDPDDPAARERAAEFHFDATKERIEVLLVAATRQGIKGKDRFPAVMQSLEEWLNYVYCEFNLANEVDQLLRERTFDVVKDTFNVGFLRASIAEGNPFKFRFKDSKKLKDSDAVEVEFEHYVKWDDAAFWYSRPKRTPAKLRRDAHWDFSEALPPDKSKLTR
jgi:DNA-binding XRE family transcriptional regulator